MERDPLLVVLWIASFEYGARVCALDRDLAALVRQLIVRKRPTILA